MTAVILTLHVLIVLGLIVMVLLQRSDGSALGIGGGSGGGFMSGRSAANALTRTTSVLAAIFFATSLSLAIIAGAGESDESVIEELTGEAAPDEGALIPGVSTDDLLNSLGSEGNDAGSEGGQVAPAEPLDALDALGAEISDEVGESAPEAGGAATEPAPTDIADEADEAPEDE